MAGFFVSNAMPAAEALMEEATLLWRRKGKILTQLL